MRTWAFAIALAACGFAEERATITGKVTDSAGKPVEQVTVLIYSAGVKAGYSTYCPTCYVDCGKRAITDADGNFTIAGVAPDLKFTLLAIEERFTPTWIRNVDPAKGEPTRPVVLKARTAVEDLSRVVRGRVVDVRGDPVKFAVVEQKGVTYRGPDGKGGTQFGDVGWTEPLAVTNARGEFELVYSLPAQRVIMLVSGRGLAPKLFTAPAGADRKTMTVTDGVTIRGRLVHDGKPVANAELGLSSHSRLAGTSYPEVRIGTLEDGTFAITNVPPGRVWYLYAKMESLAGRGAADVVLLATKDDGQEVDVGDIRIKPAHTLRGRVVLSDGKPIPEGMRMLLSADRAWDSQIVMLGPDGRFEFKGLLTGAYTLSPAVKGYEIPDRIPVEALVDRDVNEFTVRLVPAEASAARPQLQR